MSFNVKPRRTKKRRGQKIKLKLKISATTSLAGRPTVRTMFNVTSAISRDVVVVVVVMYLWARVTNRLLASSSCKKRDEEFARNKHYDLPYWIVRQYNKVYLKRIL